MPSALGKRGCETTTAVPTAPAATTPATTQIHHGIPPPPSSAGGGATTTSSGARYVATMSQSGDPGYKATSVMLGECALALAMDRDKLPELYGVLTPAAAMGDALLARFPGAGISLESARLN